MGCRRARAVWSVSWALRAPCAARLAAVRSSEQRHCRSGDARGAPRHRSSAGAPVAWDVCVSCQRRCRDASRSSSPAAPTTAHSPLPFSLPRLLQRAHADKVLVAFKEHPEAWTRVDAILETASNPNTKFIALQVRPRGEARRRGCRRAGVMWSCTRAH